MPAPTTQTSAAVSDVSGGALKGCAVSIHNDVLLGIVDRVKQKGHRTAGQGGPKTLPAAILAGSWWRGGCPGGTPERRAPHAPNGRGARSKNSRRAGVFFRRRGESHGREGGGPSLARGGAGSASH